MPVGRPNAQEELRLKGLKRCCACKEVKPLAQFYASKGNCYCKPCSLLRTNSVEAVLWRDHRLTLEQVERTLVAQGGRCANAGCRAPIDLVRNASAKSLTRAEVDHDHGKRKGEPGYFRGLLCHGCNSSSGHAGDNAIRLRGLADYLEAHDVAGR